MLQSAMASSERIFKLLDEPVDIARRRSGSPRPLAEGRRRGHIVFDHVWFAYNAGEAWRAAGRLVRGAAGRADRHRRRDRRRARRRSSTCCCGSTTCSGARSWSTASTCASWPLERAARGCSAWCCRTCTCSRARSPTTSGSGTPAIDDDAVRRAAEAVHADAFIERLPHGYDSAGGRARRHAVGRPEAAAVVRAGAGVRPAGAGARRGDVERRHRDRTADPRRAATC